MGNQNWKSKTCRLSSCLLLVFAYFVIELTVGYICNSLALQADAFHMLSDGIGLLLSLITVRFEKRPADRENTFGWQRASVVGPLINSVILQTLCFTIAIDAITRFIKLELIKDPILLLIVGSVGLLINIISLILLHGSHGHSHGDGGAEDGHSSSGHGHGHSHGHEHGHGHSHGHDNEQAITGDEFNMNERGGGGDTDEDKSTSIATSDTNIGTVSCITIPEIRQCDDDDLTPTEVKKSLKKVKHDSIFAAQLHVIADLLGSIVVIVTALVIYFIPPKSEAPAWQHYVDPSLSVIIVAIATYQNFPFMLRLSKVLMQSVPPLIKIDTLREKLREIESVIDVHDLHVWQLRKGCNIGTVHVVCSISDDFSRHKITHDVKQMFHKENIHCTTIQLENHSHSKYWNIDSNMNQCRHPCLGNECVFDECCNGVRKRQPPVA